MGRSPTCSKDGLNKGAWTAAEDKILLDYVKVHGEGKWSRLSRETGLKRCGKSCRLRWMNYLRPDIKRGNISPDEEELIIRLHKLLGNRWSLIAGRLPGRTDNEIKNYWNTNLAKKPEALRTVPFCHTEKKPIIKPGTTSEPELDQQRTEECKVGGVTDPKPPTAQQIASNLDLGPSTNSNDLLKQILSDSDMSDGSLSLNSAEEGSADFMMDFNVDDICRFLDTDFSKLNANQNGEVNDECENKYPSYINQHFVLPDVEKDLNASDRLREDSISGFQSLASFFEPDDGKWAVTAAAADDNVNFVCSGKSD